MATTLSEVIEFLTIAGDKGFLNDNTVVSRKTACNKFFDILEPDQKTVEYVNENLGVIKKRFSNLNKDVRGNTVDEYARRVKVVLSDFSAWKTDRSGWERSVSNRQSSRPANDTEKKPNPKKPEKAKTDAETHDQTVKEEANLDERLVSFPIRPDFELTIKLPRAGLTVSELKKLVYFLLPYAQDWKPAQSPPSVFPMLEQEAE